MNEVRKDIDANYKHEIKDSGQGTEEQLRIGNDGHGRHDGWHDGWHGRHGAWEQAAECGRRKLRMDAPTRMSTSVCAANLLSNFKNPQLQLGVSFLLREPVCAVFFKKCVVRGLRRVTISA